MIPMPEFTLRHINLRPHLTSVNLIYFLQEEKEPFKDTWAYNATFHCQVSCSKTGFARNN